MASMIAWRCGDLASRSVTSAEDVALLYPCRGGAQLRQVIGEPFEEPEGLLLRHALRRGGVGVFPWHEGGLRLEQLVQPFMQEGGDSRVHPPHRDEHRPLS